MHTFEANYIRQFDYDKKAIFQFIFDPFNFDKHFSILQKMHELYFSR